MTTPKGKIIIPLDKVERIKMVCAKKNKGLYSADLIIEDLTGFIEKELKHKLLRPLPRTEQEKADYAEKERRYRTYEGFTITESSLTRAFNGTSITRKKFPMLEEVLDLYLEEFDPVELSANLIAPPIGVSPFFSQQVMIILSKNAGDMCSNPYCHNPTTESILTTPDKMISLGAACLIHGVRPTDPRYDPAITYEKDDIKNGIWLCLIHAQRANYNSIDYPASLLRDWKTIHEELIRAWREGRKRIFFALNSNDNQSELAAEILAFFDTQQALFTPQEPVIKEDMITMVKGITAFLQSKGDDVLFGTRLEQQIVSLDYTCDAFLDLINKSKNATIFDYSFAAFRKIAGMVLAEMAAFYKVKLPAHIHEIAPKYENNTGGPGLTSDGDLP